jgi:PAS domain S-box-containing protein
MHDTTNFDIIDILLVDDKQENLLALEAVLACPEYNLIKTTSGDEALRYLLDNTPALILMDVQMPDLNGFETASIIKGSLRTREVPIIFITAINKDEQFVHQGYRHGAVDYIYKPYDVCALKTKVGVFADIRRQHNRISRLVAVQWAATQALAESADVGAAISNVLESICTSLKWDIGIFWRLDKHANLLKCHSEWHEPTRDAPPFITDSFGRRFSAGIGVPGRTWADKKAIWTEDLLKESNFQRLKPASKEGIHTAVAVPVFVQDETMGVLEFYSRNTLPDDPDLVKIMTAIGSQVGQVLKRTEAHELVRISEARKAAIVETALDCIISMDHEGRIIEFNPAAEAVFRRSRSEVIGKDMAETIIPHAYRAAHRKGLKHYLATAEGPVMDQRIELTGMRSDHSEFPVELAITRVTDVDPPLFTGFLRDITERKKIENRSAFLMEASTTLSSSLNYEETFSAIAHLAVKSLSDWCLIDLVEEGGGAQVRSVAVAHLDPSKSDLADKLREKYPPDWNSLTGAPNVIRTGKSELYPDISDVPSRATAENQAHLGWARELGPASAMIVPLTARTKTLGAITFISTRAVRCYSKDDLIVAEELARRAAIAIDNAKLYRDAQKAIRTRDEFFSIASHELKTPITALKMMIQVTQRSVNPEDGTVPSAAKLSKMLNTSVKQIERLSALVEDMLDVVKIQAGKLSFNLEEMDFSDLLKNITEQFSDTLATARCPLELKLEPGLIGTWDRNRIEQVMVNLISNAIKYAPGSTVKVEASHEAETVRFLVQDFGPGIPLDQQEKIFERFERAVASQNINGLGLGLFIVKQIVEAHGGTIRVISEVGAGSTFIVEMPMQPSNIIPQNPRGIGGPPGSQFNLFQPVRELGT